MLKKDIQQLAAAFAPQVVAVRRYLHQHPELSFREYETSAYIKAKLTDMQIPWQPIAGTGVVALLKGDLPGDKVIALRTDMDALPIAETNDFSFKSVNPQVMHACGHDAHMASLFGAADILQNLTPKFGGTVKLIFQPGEEVIPGGAIGMIREGVLKNPEPLFVIGQHVRPTIEAGKIAICKGKAMASMDEIIMHVHGKGGHAAQPHQNIDPVLIASQIIVMLQQVVSRKANPTTPSVLSFGKVIANGAVNIIPDEVYIEGTFRTLDETWRKAAKQQIISMSMAIAASMGGSCTVKFTDGYPCLVNDEPLTDRVRTWAEDYLGKEQVLDSDIWMAAEDFAYYGREKPACFYYLGVGNEQQGINASLHTPGFTIDEKALEVGPGLMAYIALQCLLL